MPVPVTLTVATGAEGLELVEALAQRGLPAALVSQRSAWRVEVVAGAEPDAVLVHELAIALEGASRSLRRPLPVLVGGRRYEIRPHLDIVEPPLRAA